MLNRRTFLTFCGYMLSLPVAAQFSWNANSRGGNSADEPRLSEVAVVMLRAKRLLSDPSHWCKRTYCEGGKYCLMGAIITEAYRDRQFTPCLDSHIDGAFSYRRLDTDKALQDGLVHTINWVVCRVLEFRSGSRSVVPQLWNDHPDTTFDDVVGLLDQVITFELSDTFAAKVIEKTDPDVLSLLQDTRVGFDVSSCEPNSVVDAVFQRVMRFPVPSQKVGV
jgi:hypothetical protein